MGKRLCAPSPPLGLTRRGLSLRLRSNGAWQRRPIPVERRAEDWRPRDRPCGDCAPRTCAGGGVGSRGCLPSTPLCRLTGTRGDGCGASRNVRLTLRTISLPAECKAWAARWPVDRLRQSVNSRLGRWKTRKTDDPAAIGPSYRDGIGQARRSRKTGRSAASHAAAGWTDRLRILVCSSCRIVGPGRGSAAW